MSEVDSALEVAGSLATAGCAIFAAPFVGWGAGSGGCGYELPRGWQTTEPGRMPAWAPGDALCLIGGYAVDVVDFDPRNGSGAAREAFSAQGWDRAAIGVATTPSGGEHLVIPATGLRKGQGLWPGVDLQAGTAAGGRGFAFIAPTIKASKADGSIGAYAWTSEPLIEELDSSTLEFEGLRAELAARSARYIEADEVPFAGRPDFASLEPETQRRVSRFADSVMAALERELREAATWGEGERPGGRGWEKVTADAFYRGARLGLDPAVPMSLADVASRLARVAPTDEGWTYEDVKTKWYAQVRAAQRAGALG